MLHWAPTGAQFFVTHRSGAHRGRLNVMTELANELRRKYRIGIDGIPARIGVFIPGLGVSWVLGFLASGPSFSGP